MSDDQKRTAESAVSAAAASASGSSRIHAAGVATASGNGSNAGSGAAAKSDSRAAPPAGGGGRGPAFEGNKIVFYCSNHHRIEVDRAWAGKRGTCSKQGCGVPVVIPIPPGLERPAEASRPGSLSAGRTAGEPDLGFDAAVGAAEWDVDLDQIEHPTAKLVARLWLERVAGGGVVEVHLAGGSVIMPQWYDPLWSCGTHALFAAPAADGTVTLTAVAWDQVQKVVVRQLEYVPDDLFKQG